MPHSRLSILKALALSSLFLFACSTLQPSAKPDYTATEASMDLVFVKGGTYQMGGTGQRDEQPIHRVTLQDLYVGMYEVTFAQYDQYCDTNPACKMPSDEEWGRGQRPVINVTWHEANAYAAWLSQKTGQEFRLPTESEWEYFARADTKTKYWTGDSIPLKMANCNDCDAERKTMTTPVGAFAPNPWKIYDTIGNVREWTQDDYQNTYANAPEDGTPVLSTESPGKSVRGGAFYDRAKDSRASSRDWLEPGNSSRFLGFRLVMQPENPPAAKAK